ncbi:hypothetical protein VOLCADRAFT_89278 [Volvox carteri f. nagariensis]|uniref:Uncharacterized protein n=1 Tax=Volvox carteri f. nagariensis TaxID=3068 RepID=D8TRA5_VOLCA|nr:uncharacterized protein VOLCADRAFT_89278 [Volvox carteri f. nagariensis]EFJ49858.1 hypothetical protein VOLCADRAFT_89278 [Volvox carteri f. nagariensis]|eukprot:XP_002948923.1 hypothetical protein VOLCADRAFT_89278 [Volvox carteri f. nagariensis]
MDAAEGLEQLFAAHSAVPALAVLQLLRKDLSQQQAQILFKNHRHCLQMGTCSFGRRGRAAYALRTGTEVQRLRLDFSQQSLKSCCTTTGGPLRVGERTTQKWLEASKLFRFPGAVILMCGTDCLLGATSDNSKAEWLSEEQEQAGIWGTCMTREHLCVCVRYMVVGSTREHLSSVHTIKISGKKRKAKEENKAAAPEQPKRERRDPVANRWLDNLRTKPTPHSATS